MTMQEERGDQCDPWSSRGALSMSRKTIRFAKILLNRVGRHAEEKLCSVTRIHDDGPM
jgi:hypothetical protein